MRVGPKEVSLDLPKVENQEVFIRRSQEGSMERFQEEVKREIQEAQSTKDVSDEDIRRMMEEIKRKFDMLSKYLRIDIDRDLSIPVAKIIERETERVIRQIPPDYLLNLMKKIDQMLAVLVEKEA